MHEAMKYGKILFGSAIKVYIKGGIFIIVSILEKICIWPALLSASCYLLSSPI